MSDAWRKKLTESIDFDDQEFYGKLGFKSGLEIHQQLDTKKKLFCHCPVGYRNDEPDAIILRHMRPTLSEMGTYDGTALMEFKTRKQVIYQLYRENVCTYEMDDTPPFPINQKALDYAIEIALMLNCQLVDEVHITRKQYLDGSIPTGFQRTAIVGVNGWIPYRGRKIRIQQLALEEDACREVQDRGHEIVFRTDRLSTPLVEIVTKPDMLTPYETAEVDGLLGRLMRASGRVRRGIGTARQDVNVSITGSDRIEIKGVPRTGDIRPLTHYEALRQKSLLELRERLNNRGITPETFKADYHDITPHFTDAEVFSRSGIPESAERIMVVNLADWQGLLKHQTQPGITFAAEIAGRVRVIACLDRMPNILVLDSQPEGMLHGELGLPIELEEHIRAEIGADEDDTLVVVWGPAEDAETGAKEIIIRAKEAIEKIPQETRQHMPDKCRTDFERILPGPDRMYPDTDSPPVALAPDRVSEIRNSMALRPWERMERYLELGLPRCLAGDLSIHRHACLFERLVAGSGISPLLLAEALVSWQKAITRARLEVALPPVAVDEDVLESFFTDAAAKKTPRRGLLYAFEKLLNGEDVEPLGPLSEGQLKTLCLKVIEEYEDYNFKQDRFKLDFLLGEVLERSEGRAEPAKVRKILKELT
ncbi:Glu-tRNA(Gln) amidotransferase subunit GatE [candidate division WOR-3 bacterium]|uniref:Glu-tRNA(Gln) amidotransferase subunit GatE n=1 Tax=candidate division WOR-3 bacterium TaxID=2052148 RepID=A0A9D5K9N6_UNCW3|nr:Glu-tRNA(Gln) amidotransferase subunit GatE [candidate division WOR-3 bacterium]MBD3363846.1 Glu-tRNA(Gln) amidotransferase subunit GatE [candidate division WOR-3 bacterium]